MRKTVCYCLALGMLFISFASKPTLAEGTPSVTAQGACVLEAGTNTVLYSKNAHEKLPMASTTKVMTAILAIERGNPDEIITTCDEAYGTEGSSIYLKKNEKISLRDLLYGLMLRSGNDAAVAIAVHIGGSVDGFVSLMNEKAREIGAVNTQFKNPNGLPIDGHYTTAYDLAIICSYALSNEVFSQIVSTQYHTADTGEVKRTMMNKNKLLFQYEGAIGIKTGYTKAAGKSLTFAASRENMKVVGVVLNCPDMFNDSMTLMDFCFDTYEMYTVLKGGTIVMRTFVKKSPYAAVLVTDKDVCIPVRKSEGIRIHTRISVHENLSAPARAGDSAGKVELYSGSKLIGRCNLIFKDDVPTYTYSEYLYGLIRSFTA